MPCDGFDKLLTLVSGRAESSILLLVNNLCVDKAEALVISLELFGHLKPCNSAVKCAEHDVLFRLSYSASQPQIPLLSWSVVSSSLSTSSCLQNIRGGEIRIRRNICRDFWSNAITNVACRQNSLLEIQLGLAPSIRDVHDISNTVWHRYYCFPGLDAPASHVAKSAAPLHTMRWHGI